MKLEILTSFFEQILQQKPKVSLTERSFLIKKKSGFYLMLFQNADIWSCLASQQGQLTEQNLSGMALAYATFMELYPNDNPPVSEVATIAGIKELRSNRFFRRIAFDYDDCLTDPIPLRPQNVLMRMRRDVKSLTRPSFVPTQALEEVELFRKDTDSVEKIWKPTKKAVYTYTSLVHEVTRILPLLNPDEVIKAQTCYKENGFPLIVPIL